MSVSKCPKAPCALCSIMLDCAAEITRKTHKRNTESVFMFSSQHTSDMNACATSIRSESGESVRARGSGNWNTTINQYQCAIIVQELQMSPFTDVWRSWQRRQNERRMRRRGDERGHRKTHPRSGRGRHASFYQRRWRSERIICCFTRFRFAGRCVWCEPNGSRCECVLGYSRTQRNPIGLNSDGRNTGETKPLL